MFLSATIISLTPPGIPLASGQGVVIAGQSMADCSSDPSAFVLASSCLQPNTTSPTPVPLVTSAHTGSGSTILLTLDSSLAVSGGSYRLCARWTSDSPYFDAGSLSLIQATLLSPNVIGISGTTPFAVDVIGLGLVDVDLDGQAFVLSPSCAGIPASVVTSISSAYNTSNSIALSISDPTSTAGVYPLCLRASASSGYFPLGLDINIGALCPSHSVLF